MRQITIAKVAVENTTVAFDMLFDYFVPSDLLAEVSAGKRVIVPFGKGSTKRVGIVFSVKNNVETDKTLKFVSEVLDKEPLLSNEMLLTANYIHDQTFCTYFEACKLFFPIALSMKLKYQYALNQEYQGEITDALEKQVFDYLYSKNQFISSESICKNIGVKNTDLLDNMVKKGILFRNIDAQQKIGDASIKMVRPLVDVNAEGNFEGKITKKQLEVLKILCDVGSVSVREICYFTGFSSNVVTALESKGFVEIFDEEIYRAPYDVDIEPKQEPIILSEEQNHAFTELLKLYKEKNARCSLLYGVTGSGKTQVYLKLIDEALKDNRGIIVMIPEISLTPQLLSLFYERYGNKIAVFHSALSLGQRLDEWKRVKRGEAKIAIGTRSAVFAPFDDIGLIIIDEEQEHTYKSEMTPRYHTRDVAGYRISKHNGLLLLASATPSIESYTKAQNGIYKLLELKQRYGNAVLPTVEIIDTTYSSDMIGENISKRLAEELKENFDNKKQSILLLNRRGYNTYASCKECGSVITCPQCSISLTHHIKNGRLICHYCGYSIPFTKICPKCNTESVSFTGYGTQKLEEELASIVPDAKVLRMDTDTTVSRFSYEEKFGSFAKGDYDILIGTQMVAKGLDFPNVTLVGVLNIDSMLYNDDYKSAERAFDLITQVVGRSGRGEYLGKAYIQTSFPDSEVITLAKNQDFNSFYNIELPIRQALIYPPFCDICVVGFSGEKEANVYKVANSFLNNLRQVHSDEFKDINIIVLGPVVPRVAKIAGKYRSRILIKCRNNKRFREMMNFLLKSFTKDKNDVSIYVDLNPENLM